MADCVARIATAERMATITFEPLSAALLDQTAHLHVLHMPRDLASQLGEAVVRDIFHRGTLEYPGGISVVARVDGDVAGFCFGHVDFRAFSAFQRRHRLRFYGSLLPGLVRRPFLLPELFSARRYLNLCPRFVNLGPLLVTPEFRNARPRDTEHFSLASELARRIFAEVARQAPVLPVLTMIRPSNLPSITAVAQAALRSGYKLRDKFPIHFRNDPRLVFHYRCSAGSKS